MASWVRSCTNAKLDANESNVVEEVVAELVSGELDRTEIQKRLDQLTCNQGQSTCGTGPHLTIHTVESCDGFFTKDETENDKDDEDEDDDEDDDGEEEDGERRLVVCVTCSRVTYYKA